MEIWITHIFVFVIDSTENILVWQSHEGSEIQIFIDAGSITIVTKSNHFNRVYGHWKLVTVKFQNEKCSSFKFSCLQYLAHLSIFGYCCGFLLIIRIQMNPVNNHKHVQLEVLWWWLENCDLRKLIKTFLQFKMFLTLLAIQLVTQTQI